MCRQLEPTARQGSSILDGVWDRDHDEGVLNSLDFVDSRFKGNKNLRQFHDLWICWDNWRRTQSKYLIPDVLENILIRIAWGKTCEYREQSNTAFW